MLEGCAIREFFVSSLEEAVALALIIQLPCLLCLLFATLIGDWIHRKKFNLYYCKLETGIDIDYIKENASLINIDKDVELSQFGCTIGTHIGPNGIGIAFFNKQK